MLTRVDLVEKKLQEQYEDFLNKIELELKLREFIDNKIESVVLKLGVPRTSVHFIENYNEISKVEVLCLVMGFIDSCDDITVDYYALKLLE